MRKIVFALAILSVLFSCEKEEPIEVPAIVEDQSEIEKNLVGRWKGEIKASGRLDETVEVVIQGEMNIGNKVATGRVYNASFSCDFEWTYEAFNQGKVTFREKTLDPDICYDDVKVVANFESDSFDHLYLNIPVGNSFFMGILVRQ